MTETILGQERISRLFFRYSIPGIAAMLFLGLNTIVDGLFAGHYIGADALASVNIAMPFSSLMIALSIMIGIGAQSLIGRKLGAGKTTEAADTFRTALLLCLGFSLFFATIAAALPEKLATLLGASPHLAPMVSTYICYTGIFLPFLSVMLVLDYVLKTIARPAYAMMALIISVSSHMFFTWLLVAHLQMGIKGAALSLGIGCTLAFFMTAFPFFKRKQTLHFFIGNWQTKTALRILYSGFAEGLTEIGTGITAYLFNITLMQYTGETGIAAFTIIGYLSFIGNNLLIGLSDGSSAIISYNYGSRKIERVKKTLYISSLSAVFTGLLIFILLHAKGAQIVRLFLDESNTSVLTFAASGAEIYAFAFLINGLNIIFSGYFTAIGKPTVAAIISGSKGILFVAVAIVLLPKIFGIAGIWLSIPLAEALTLLLSTTLLYRHFKQAPPLS